MTSRVASRVRTAALFAVPALALAACGGDPGGDRSAGQSPVGSASAGPSRAGSAPAPRVAGTVAEGLDAPWGLAFLPGGDALVSQRDDARVMRVRRGGGVEEVGQVPGVEPGGEGGLLGLAVGPDFARDRQVYAYFTAAEDNRLVRMRYDEGGRLGAPEVLLEGVDKAAIHNGGRIAFGPDRMLYVATGDAAERGSAQDQGDPNGKILRLTPDGKPAPGNPFPGSPVWSLGHRNVQGLAWDDAGQLWASEFGQNTWDELNRIEAGRNYGWPEVEGKAGDGRFADPAVVWRPSEASPSGVAVAGGAAYVAGLRGQRLLRVPLQGGGVGEPDDLFVEEYGRLRTVERAPDGSLWLMTSNTDNRGNPRQGDDRILRLTLPG